MKRGKQLLKRKVGHVLNRKHIEKKLFVHPFMYLFGWEMLEPDCKLRRWAWACWRRRRCTNKGKLLGAGSLGWGQGRNLIKPGAPATWGAGRREESLGRSEKAFNRKGRVSTTSVFWAKQETWARGLEWFGGFRKVEAVGKCALRNEAF